MPGCGCTAIRLVVDVWAGLFNGGWLGLTNDHCYRKGGPMTVLTCRLSGVDNAEIVTQTRLR